MYEPRTNKDEWRTCVERQMLADLNDVSDPISQEAKARGSMYQFLAAVYLHPPTEDVVRQTKNQEFIEDLTALFSEQAATGLKEYTATRDPKAEIALLKQEYLNLFVVPAGRYVTPFEDVYRGIRQDGKQERGPLLGEQAVSAKVAYREAGAQMDQSCKELPTHIGVELSFMEFLCERETVMIEKQDEGGQDIIAEGHVYRQFQHRFLHEHLNNWFPQLNQAIQQKTESYFYRALAQLTEEFLVWDMTELDSLSIPEKPTQDQASLWNRRAG